MNYTIQLIFLFSTLFTLKNHPRQELLKIYSYNSEIDSLFLRDSLYKYYNKEGKLTKLIHPAHKFTYSTKYATSALFRNYNKKGQLVREYSYYAYSEEPNYMNSLEDSIVLSYKEDKLIERKEFLNGTKSNPRVIKYFYKNKKLSYVTDSHQLDSIVVKYLENNEIEKTHYNYGELCYEENIKVLSKLDTLVQLKYNGLNENCGFYSNRLIRKIYEKDGDIKLMVMKGYIKSHRFTFYDRGNVIKRCEDSLQASCEIENEYEYDNENNWISKIEKIRGEISQIEKRTLIY